jgi:uncharacterized protein (TIGR03437 family)
MPMISFSSKRFLAGLPVAFLPILLRANSDGAIPRVTGAPGDDPAACTSCHTGTSLNSGPGSLTITAAGGANYTPGVKQRIKVTVADPTARRWGFSLSPRVASNPATGRAGRIGTVDRNTRVLCDGDTPAPCADANAVEFITHTLSGTRLGTTRSVDFEFDWTPPATGVGRVTLYGAGNAANGTATETGDRIYTAKLDLTPAAAVTKPAISSERGVLNAATAEPAVSANAWLRISGLRLASTSASWDAEKFEEKKLPVALEGVSVTVNGKDAYIQSVSPERILALTPADDAQGEVEIIVKAASETSDPVKVKLEPFAPGPFTHDGKYVTLTRGEDKPIARPEQIPAKDKDAAIAKSGEKVTIYATGLGATDPETPAGRLAEAEAPTKAPVKVTIGGTDAVVEFAGIRPGSAAIYQIVLTVPEGLADGDHRVIVQVQDVKSPEPEGCCFLKVQTPKPASAPAEPTSGERSAR